MPKLSRKLTAKLDVTQLPSLPHVLLELLDACNRSEPSFTEIAGIVSKDSALTAKVLGLVSSPAYQRLQKVDSLERLLQLIGIDGIKSLAVSAAVYHVFSQIGASTLFDMKLYWRHSLLCAEFSRQIATKIAYPAVEEAYLTGLLHDIGRLLLWVNFPKEYSSILLDDAEEANVVVNGDHNGPVNHAEVGAWLIGNWKLPSLMSDAVLYHHQPGERLLDAHELIKITHLANQLSQESTFTGTVPANDAALLFGFGNEDLAQLLTTGLKQIGEASQALEIEIEAAEPEEQGEPKERRRFRGELQRGGESPGTNGVDAAKKLQLAREVRDLALFESIRVNLDDVSGLEGILRGLQQCMRILAGVPNATFFAFDSVRHGLRGKAIGDQNVILDQLFVPLDGNKSLLSNAVLSKTPRHSFSARERANSLFDEQLLRILNRDGMLCVPLLVGPRILGAMVFGIERNQLPRLEKQLKLIALFAAEAAKLLDVETLTQRASVLLESQKVSEVQSRARRIAHEINNPLAIMKNYIAALKRKLENNEAAQEDLQILNDEIDRVAGIVRGLSTQTEPAPEMVEGVDINAIITDSLKLTEESLLRPRRIAAFADLADGLPPVATDRNKLKQVLMNLIKNAAEAMRETGELTIATRDNINQDGQVFVEIAVRDSGPGIPAGVMAQLFEPVQTSKGGAHAGLGLAIVKSLVKQMKGHIMCQSSAAGTSFRILLPRSARGASE